MDEILIRQALQADLPTLVRFTRQMLEEMAALGGKPLADEAQVTRWLEERLASALPDPLELSLVAETGYAEGRLAGFVGAALAQPLPVFQPEPSLHIHSLYVLPAWRRQGLAQRLLRAALSWGQAHGCLQADLHVLPDNPARRLYEKLGFQVAQLEMVCKL